jgi:uncharacterized phiE125 gp8 family phage protein
VFPPELWGSIGTRAWTPPHSATKLFTAPAIEPFTTDEAKAHLKITVPDDDALVAQWIKAARSTVEQDTQRALLTQTWDLTLDWPPSYGRVVEIPFPPLQSVTSVNATDTAGAETVWPSSNYIVDTGSEPGRIGLTDTGTWPTSVRMFMPIRIRFVAGWTASDQIPPDLRAAVALVMGWLSENRQPAPFEVKSYDNLIQPYVIFSAA